MNERPLDFRIDYQSPLAKGLVFAGLGRHPRSNRYTDSSLFKNAGALTAMDANSDWVWEPRLGRFKLVFDQTVRQYIVIPYSPSLFSDTLTVSMWVDLTTTTPTNTIYFFSQYETSGNKRQWAVYGSSTLAPNQFGIGTSSDGTINSTQIFHPSPVYLETELRHVAFTANNATKSWSAYRDGVLVQTITVDYAYINVLAPTTIGGVTWGDRTSPSPITDPMLYNRILSLPEIQQHADPSNVMLSGLILPPRRRWWPVVSAATTKIPVFMNHYRNLRVSA